MGCLPAAMSSAFATNSSGDTLMPANSGNSLRERARRQWRPSSR